MSNSKRCASAVAVIAAMVGVLMGGQMASHAASVVGRSARTAKATSKRPSTQPAGFRKLATTRPANATTRPASQPVAMTTQPSTSKVIVYYFHRTLRCPTCRRMEALSKQAIDSAFSRELASGMIEWRPLDFQQKGNERFAKAFKLEAPALILVKMTHGKQAASQDMDKIWDLVGTPSEFTKYVQNGLRACLSERLEP